MKGLASSGRGNWCDCPPKARSFGRLLHWCGLRTDNAALSWLLKDDVTAQRCRRSVQFSAAIAWKGQKGYYVVLRKKEA